MSTNKTYIDNKDDARTLDRWEKAYTQAPPVMRPDSHGNDEQMANYPKAGDWGLKIPAGMDKIAVSPDRKPEVNQAIEAKQMQWQDGLNKRHQEMRKDLAQQPLVDQERMNLTIQTEQAAYNKWTNPDRNTVSGAKAHDTYINTFSKLIEHDTKQGHPISEPGRDFKAEPVSAREQYDWLKRDGRETTAQERSYIQSSDLWDASAPRMADGTSPRPVVQQDFDKEVFGAGAEAPREGVKSSATPTGEEVKATREALKGEPAKQSAAQTLQDGAKNGVNDMKQYTDTLTMRGQVPEQKEEQRPQLDMGGLKDRLATRRMPSQEELVAEHKEKFGGAKFKHEGMSYAERVREFQDVSQKASDVRSGVSDPLQRPSQSPGVEMDKQKHKVSI